MIKTENLSFSYGEGQSVLNDINIEIEDGAFVAVLGHNGSGKSTFAKHLNAFGPENLGVEPSEIKRRVDEALSLVGMSEFSHAAPHNLSGGQKQRIAIAGIIAMQPSCIVLDEPTAMLDPSGRREVMDTVKRLNREKGIGIVLITHYMDEAAEAERVIVIDSGSVVLDGTPQEVFVQYDKLRSLRLDVPQVTELMHKLKAAGLPVNEKIISEDDCIDELLKLLKK